MSALVGSGIVNPDSQPPRKWSQLLRPMGATPVIGNVFVWGGSAFYDVYDAGDDYLGLSPDGDQSLAGSLMMLEGSLVTIVALAWLFLRMAQEGEVRQELIEKGVDERTARRAVRYRRWEELA